MSDVELVMGAIEYLVPKARYMIRGETFQTISIVWNDERPQPTKKQIADAIPLVRDIVEEQIKNKSIDHISKEMGMYIDNNIPIHFRSYLNSVCVRYTYDIARGIVQSDFENIAKKAIKIFAWIDSIFNHYFILVNKINNDVPLTENDTNWEALFDTTKPDILTFM